MRPLHDLIRDHIEDHRLHHDRAQYASSDTEVVRWLRNISESLDALLLIMSNATEGEK